MKLNRTTYFLIGLLVLCLALSYKMAMPFLGPGLLALLLSIGFYPLYQRLLRAIRKPTPAAMLATLLVYVVILLPLGITIALLADDIAAQVRALQNASAQEGGFGPLISAKAHAVIHWVAPRLNVPEDYLMDQLTSRAQAAAQGGLALLGAFLVNAGSSLVDFIIASVILFFFLRDGAQIRQALLDFIPLTRDDGEELVRVVEDTIAANLYGVVGVALIQGMLATTGFFIAGIPSALTWGAFATIFSFIPFVGATIVWIPACLWLLNQGHYGQTIFLVIWCTVVVGLADNLLRPLLVGGKTHQHSLLVFFSLLGGTAAFGILGLFVGPLLVSIIIAVFKVLRRELAS